MVVNDKQTPTVVLAVRVDRELRRAYELEAEASGESLSAVVRETLDRHAPRREAA